MQDDRLVDPLWNDWQIDEAAVIDPLGSLDIVGRLGEKDVIDKALRIAVIERKPARLHLHHNAMSRQKNMIGIRQFKHIADNFIGRMENLGLIDRLGWIVIDHAMREVGQFADIDGMVPTLSLNVSVHSLRNLEFPDRFLAVVEKYGISAGNVTIEITETGLIKELSTTLDVLTRLRMKQVQLSIDDFGTGYAMMQQLRNVPATELKIDKSFVQNIQCSDRDRVMVQKTIEIGHDLGLKVIGEGVETQEQFDFLRSNHCDAAQGYLFSRPLPAAVLSGWLGEQRSRQARNQLYSEPNSDAARSNPSAARGDAVANEARYRGRCGGCD